VSLADVEGPVPVSGLVPNDCAPNFVNSGNTCTIPTPRRLYE